MPTEPKSSKLPLVAAVAATTVAVGITATSLLGWMRPAAAPPPSGPVAATAPLAEPAPSPDPEDPPVARHHQEEHDDDDDDD